MSRSSVECRLAVEVEALIRLERRDREDWSMIEFGLGETRDFRPFEVEELSVRRMRSASCVPASPDQSALTPVE